MSIENTPENKNTDFYDAAWNRQLQDLRDYMKENDGKVPYPRKGQDRDVERIGQWVNKQRRAWRAEDLREDRKAILLDIPGVLVSRTAARVGTIDTTLIREEIVGAINSAPKDVLTKTDAIELVDAGLHAHAHREPVSA